MINNQLRSLAKLQPDDSPVISTWSVKQISENVQYIYFSMQQEYKLKQLVTGKKSYISKKKILILMTDHLLCNKNSGELKYGA